MNKASCIRKGYLEFFLTCLFAFAFTLLTQYGVIAERSKEYGATNITGASPCHFALVLAVCVYCGWESSGAHLNPAVSIYHWIVTRVAKRRDGVVTCSTRQLIAYLIAQFSGSLLGCFLGRSLFGVEPKGNVYSPATYVMDNNYWLIIQLLETCGTVALVLTTYVLKFGGAKSANRLEASIVMGAAFMALIAYLSPLSGCIINPALSVGHAVSGRIALLLHKDSPSVKLPMVVSMLWVYTLPQLIIAPFVAAIVTILYDWRDYVGKKDLKDLINDFKILTSEEDKEEEEQRLPETA